MDYEIFSMLLAFSLQAVQHCREIGDTTLSNTLDGLLMKVKSLWDLRAVHKTRANIGITFYQDTKKRCEHTQSIIFWLFTTSWNLDSKDNAGKKKKKLPTAMTYWREGRWQCILLLEISKSDYFYTKQTYKFKTTRFEYVGRTFPWEVSYHPSKAFFSQPNKTFFCRSYFSVGKRWFTLDTSLYMKQDFYKSWKRTNEKRHGYKQTALLIFAAHIKVLVSVFFSLFGADFAFKSQ